MTRQELIQKLSDWMLCGREWTPELNEAWDLMSQSIAALDAAERRVAELEREVVRLKQLAPSEYAVRPGVYKTC